MNIKKFFRGMAAGIAALTLSIGGLAASAASVADATIDASKTASLSIYKYDITSAKADGVWDDDAYQSTGVYDKEGVNDVLGNPDRVVDLGNGEQSYGYAIKGVEFTYIKVADICTDSRGGHVQLLYGFDAAGTGEKMLNAMGLSWADREVAADKTVGGKQMYYFASETLQNAMAAALTANATTVKDAMEAYVKSNGGVKMTETDAYGYTTASDLELGLYLVVETRVPEYVTTPAVPMLISLPMTSVNGTNATDGGTRWMYDVTIYPKNATGNPTLEKTVRESKNDTGKNNGSTDDITDGYAHTATASEYDVVDYQVISTLPVITSAASNLTTYTYVDTLSKGITYNRNDIVIEFFKDAGCIDKITTWAQSDPLQKFAVAYGDAADGAHTMTISMTDAGLSEINTAKTVFVDAGNTNRGYSGCTMRITYAATLNHDAVLGDAGNPNTVTLEWRRTNTSYYDTLEDDCHVYTYGIDLTKKFADGKGNFANVTFSLYNATDGYYVTAELKDGIYYITGHEYITKEEAGKKTEVHFVPQGTNGKVIIRGLEDDTYTLTELTTDNGYEKQRDGIDVIITAKKGNDICPVCGKEMLVASATVDGDNVEMIADGNSIHALALVSITNHVQHHLVQTGEAGTWMLVCGGLAMAALAVMGILLATKKRKADETNY